MVYNPTFPTAPYPSSSSVPNPSLVQAVFRNDMLNVWNPILKSNNVPVQFADGGPSTLTNSACDGVNLITFVNASTTYTPPAAGVLAYTWVESAASTGVLPAGSCGPNPITINFPGQIIDTDITYNVTVPFSVDGRLITGGGGCNSASNQACDIEGTALHELGHVLGLHHSTLNSALMIPAAQQGFPNRTISSDDVAGINAAYGVNTLGGQISGIVTNSSGLPVFGAIVQLTNTTTGLPTVSAITTSTGAYTMFGFAPGNYKVWVKPIDYPFTPGNYTAEYSSAPSNSFNAQAVTTVSVAAGANTSLPIQVTIPYSATFDYVAVGTSTATSKSGYGAVVATARRAGSGSAYPSNTGTYTICADGVNLTGPITTSIPTAQTVSSTSVTGCNYGIPLTQDFTFPANTVPGFYDVYTSNDIMPSSLGITTNPFVSAGGVVDAAAYSTTYSAGSFISIFGLDLTTQTITNSVFPVPTQLGGLSVRVGDRFAPLFFVSPGQVNAMIPYEATSCSTGSTTGCAVDVQIQVGLNSVFDYGNITVVSSAPKIFTIGSFSSGTPGQGAIQDGSAPACPAACPIADGKNYTASAGDVMVIYASGLGQTSPAAIDGLAGTGTTAPATVNFSLGSVTKTVTAVYTGATSCCSALYQVNATLPSGLGTGAASVQITDSLGNKSNLVTIAVH
jgi:uncharacterized protein (TIGR03437 family)